MGGISIWQLLIILLIVLVLFGAKKLRTLGGDLGSAVKGFRNAMKEGEEDEIAKTPKGQLEQQDKGQVINVEVSKEQEPPSQDKDKA